MSRFDRQAEEAGDVAELVRLEVRVAIASDGEGVEVARLGEPARLAERLLDEAQVEADVVADQAGRPGELHEAQGRVARGRRTGHFRVGDAVHLAPTDRAARVHEGGKAIDDLAVAKRARRRSRSGPPSWIAAGGLDVDDDELRAALGDSVDEVETELVPGSR